MSGIAILRIGCSRDQRSTLLDNIYTYLSVIREINNPKTQSIDYEN